MWTKGRRRRKDKAEVGLCGGQSLITTLYEYNIGKFL
jgi:hypothetical protein